MSKPIISCGAVPGKLSSGPAVSGRYRDADPGRGAAALAHLPCRFLLFFDCLLPSSELLMNIDLWIIQIPTPLALAVMVALAYLLGIGRRRKGLAIELLRHAQPNDQQA